MKKVRIGLIGCGERLRSVTKILLEKDRYIEIIALCDPNSKSIAIAKDLFNKNSIIYDNYHEMLKNPEIDWVMIGSWNCQHAEHTIASFEAGKNVFCEKPLALSLQDCLAMKNAWKKSGKHFCIGFTLRYSPHYRKIKDLVNSGILGKIISMEFNETLDFNHGGYIHADWRRKTEWAGSHMLEKCCHDIDLANWIIDSNAMKAASFGSCSFFTSENASLINDMEKNNNGKNAYQSWNSDNIIGNIKNPFNDDKDILDNQVVLLQYENGVNASFHTNCNSSFPERRMVILGSKGTLRSDVISGKIEFKKIGFNTNIEDYSSGEKGGHGGGDDVLASELKDCMFNDSNPVSTLEDGLKAAVTVFGIDKAQETGQVYNLSELWQLSKITF